MMNLPSLPCTAFAGPDRIAQGPLAEVALAVKAFEAANPGRPILTFDDATGAVIDLDLRGTDEEVLGRLADRARQASPPEPQAGEEARGRGRPRLGVVAREVTLLPRHWDWLGSQPGGASATIRRLIDEARRADDGAGRTRAAREAAYRFMSAMAGDLPHFEEASRALFAGDAGTFAARIAGWPADIRDQVVRLAFPDAASADPA